MRRKKHKIRVKKHKRRTQNGFTTVREHSRSIKGPIKLKAITYQNKTFQDLNELRESRRDWTHYSENYPNLLGVTDEEIENIIHDKVKFDGWLREDISDYLKHIKCYSKIDLRDLCNKTRLDWYDKVLNLRLMRENDNNPFGIGSTIFLTSPRGGHEVLSIFSYTNLLKKENIPYDLWSNVMKYKTETEPDFPLAKSVKQLDKPITTLASSSLPYHDSIKDINDIVFIDDLCMSGEQASQAFGNLKFMIKEMKLSDAEMPRLHYIALVKNKDMPDWLEAALKNWDTVTFGEELQFGPRSKEWSKHLMSTAFIKPEVSAIVFPYGVPDGDRHYVTRMLYNSSDYPMYVREESS